MISRDRLMSAKMRERLAESGMMEGKAKEVDKR